MAGLESDKQDQYVNAVQNAVEGALQAAMHLDDPNYFGQKKILIMELATAKAYASQLKSGPANDAAAKAAHEIGYKDRTGKHEGEIYGGVFPDGKPGWISEEENPMSHYDAVKLKGRALPTSEEGEYIDTIKGNGDLKDIFARHSDGSSTAGYFWLAEHGGSDARYQQFSDGHQGGHGYSFRGNELPVLSVRR